MTTRVVQWGSGNVGKQAIATIAARDDMELVGMVVNSPGKVGRDAGELAGIGTLGVAATDSLDEIVALDADVVLHMPLPSLVYGDDPDADMKAFCRLLESGKHVVTTVGYMYPQVYGPPVMDRLDTACAAGNAAFHGTGANPGWFGDLLPLLMSGLSLRVDQIVVQEISDFGGYPSPEIMFDMMNFGKPPEVFETTTARHRAWLDGLFVEAVTMVATGLGLEVDGTTSDLETFVTEEDLHPAAGLVAAGTVAGQRYNWTAVCDGRPVVRQETVWRMGPSVAPDWPHGHWSITLEGEPRMRVELTHSWNRNVLGSTAAHAINAVPYLMECGPGVKTFLDLPIVAGRGAHFAA